MKALLAIIGCLLAAVCFAAPPPGGNGAPAFRSTILPLGSAGGGTPNGNVWTVATSNCVGNASTAQVPAGSAGDISIFILKWEAASGTTTLNSLSDSVNGAYTLIGSQIDSVGNPNLSMQAGMVVTTGASSAVLTPVFSGTSNFRDWVIIRCSVSGTTAYGSATGQGTSQNPASGTYTTATVNGLLVEMTGVDGATTHDTKLFGGQTPTWSQAITGTSTETAWYNHSAQQASATFTQHLGTSRNWVVKVVSATAQ